MMNVGPFSSLYSLSKQLLQGSVSSTEVTRFLLERASQIRDETNAYSQLLTVTALEEAEQSDRRRKIRRSLGPLDGVPIAVKDLIDTPPAVCSGGLKTKLDHRPATEAAVVRLLRKAGAVILGVTHSDPGAFSTDTPEVYNPLDRSLSVGGSSGGSAAAVAAGIAFGAIGTDTGGSIRIPAACCGVFGFKPTWGRVETTGTMPLAHSLDHVGPIARTIGDLHILQHILDPDFSSTAKAEPPAKCVIGVPRAFFQNADPIVCSAVNEVETRCRDMGFSVVDATLPEPSTVSGFHMKILPKEAAEYHLEHFPKKWTSYPEVARETIKLGLAVSEACLAEAQKQRAAARVAIDHCFESIDALLLPVMPIDTPKRNDVSFNIGGKTLSKLQSTIFYSSLFNHTGHPAVSLPSRLEIETRPINVQLIGARNGDKDLLNLASLIC